VIVSIARELGAGGRTVGEAVASALGGALLDERSVIAELSERHGLPADYVATRIERAPNAGERLIADLASASAMLPFALTWQSPDELVVDAVRQIVLERAARGHVVVIGHGGVSLLGWRPAGIVVLPMLLRAGRAWRIDQLARRYAIDREEACRRIDRTDEARLRFQRHYFDCDLYDCRQYDLVLNTESLGLEQATEIAVSVAAALSARSTQPAAGAR
jgi:cytidylate kinase